MWFLGFNQKTVRCLFLLGREIAENLSLLSPKMEERMKNDSGNEKLKLSEHSRIQKKKPQKNIFSERIITKSYSRIPPNIIGQCFSTAFVTMLLV